MKQEDCLTFFHAVLMSLFLLPVLQKPLLQPSVPAGGVQLRGPEPPGRAPHRKQPRELHCRRSLSRPLQPPDAVSEIQNSYGERSLDNQTSAHHRCYVVCVRMLAAYLHNLRIQQTQYFMISTKQIWTFLS